MLTPDQRTFYDQTGYVHLPATLPVDLLTMAESVLRRWQNGIIAQWLEAGLVEDAGEQVGFSQRLHQLWIRAGKPRYSRSPRRDLVGKQMYQILTHPVLLDIAADLLGTQSISVHGIFNARPKLPDQKWTDTPWHQDAQYYRDAENTHVVSMWFPLQRVTEHNSCLQVAAGHQQGVLHEGVDDEETGFRGLAPEIRQELTGTSIEMDRRDLLCFGQKTPHRALPNRSDTVRWSMDVRYEATAQSTESGRDKGFVARHPVDPAAVESCASWVARWEDLPSGAY